MGTINGLEIHHEVQGTGPPIVFVHGLGATSNVWHAQRMALSKYFQVIVYDRSGSGRSQPARDGYSIDAWADELAGLLDHLAVPKAVVVGHSLGTMVAQRFAGKYASRTMGLVLAGGEAELGPQEKRALTERARTVETHGLSAVVDAWLTAVLSAATREANPALAGMVPRDVPLKRRQLLCVPLFGIARRLSSQRPSKHPVSHAADGWRPGPSDATRLATADRRPDRQQPNSDHPKHRALDHAGIPGRIQHGLIGFLGDA